MIIEYFSDGTFAVDTRTSANDHFSLARYNKDNRFLDFRANVVVEGHTMLITHMQVTRYGKLKFSEWSEGCARKLWLTRYFGKVEEGIKNYLSKKNYKGAVKLRIKGSDSQYEILTNLGYKMVPATRSWDSYYTDIYEKTL